MAYTGASDIITGGTSTDDLSRDIYIETLEAFNRTLIGANLVMKQTIQSGKAGQFIVGGKSTDSADADTYARGTQVDVTEAEFDERIIVLERPVYEAKRVDQFEEKVAHYDVRSVITNQMGESLGNKVDREVFDKLFVASSGTGLVGNPNAGTVAAITYTGTASAKGDLLAEAIFEADAALAENDVTGETFVVLSPADYNNLVQSDKSVNADYTNGNGGFDTGVILEVAGVKVYKSNNVKGTLGGTTTAKLLGLVFTSEAVGILELIGMTTNQEKQIDFLDATLMTAYYANGVGVLRPEACVALMSA